MRINMSPKIKLRTERPCLVEMIGEGRFRLDPSVLQGSIGEVYRYSNQRYFVGYLMGITPDTTGCCIEYHRVGTDSLPKHLIAQKAIFRIVQQDDYVHKGDILELVRDANLVRRICDRVIRREGYETVHDQSKKHRRN